MAEPKVGEIRSGKEIGKRADHRYLFNKCKICRICGWQRLDAVGSICRKCSSKINAKSRLTVPKNLSKPQIGDICSGGLLGKPRVLHVYTKCAYCGKPKWNQLRNREQLCSSCAHKKNYAGKASNWKGGRYTDKNGYVFRYISRDSKYFVMAKKKRRHGGDVAEHRLVMARFLKRPLESWEQIHHWDEDKSNNSLSNLFMTSPGEHNSRYKHGEKTGYREGYSRAYKDIFMKTIGLLQALEKKSLSNTLSVGR